MKMELVRNCIFLSEMTIQVSKSQSQKKEKIYCTKSEFLCSSPFPFGTNINGKNNDNYSLSLNPTCSQRELLVQDDFCLLRFQCHEVFGGIVSG